MPAGHGLVFQRAFEMTPVCGCGGHVIENWALNNKFYVCTECKQEVYEDPSPNATDPTPSRVWTTYPVTPTPLAVELVGPIEQNELFIPWVEEFDLPKPNNKDDQDNG